MQRVERWEAGGLVLGLILFVLSHLPLWVHPGIDLGWNSDAALLGLMARALVHGDIPWLFWACDYLAPLTSVFAAGTGLLLGEIGPLALRLGVAVEVCLALLFYHAAMRRVVGSRAALMGTLWMAVGPLFYFRLTYAPLSAEQYFFLGAVIFYYAVRARFDRLHRWLVLGLLTGLGWWIHRGTMFVVLPVLGATVLYDARRLRRRDVAVGSFVLTLGIVIGLVPKVIGLYGLDQRLYAPVNPPWSPAGVASMIRETFTHDLWVLLGANWFLGWLAAAVILILLVGAGRHFSLRRETFIALGVVLVSFAFWIGSTYAYRGAVRYIMISLPIMLGFAAGELVRQWDANRRRTAFAAGAIVLVAWTGAAVREVRGVVGGQREIFEQWGGFDPRPVLAELHQAGYRVCYANVWEAHKLEWLSEPTVHFIPYRSVNRRMVESLRLAGIPGRKCFVDRTGHVRTLSPEEEQAMRLDILRQMQAGPH